MNTPGLEGSRLIYGCMRLAGDGSAAAMRRGRHAVRAALDAGFTTFDHADIYSGGQCEQIFGAVLRDSPSLRDQLQIIGKCGIRHAGEPSETSPGRYDFSSKHLLTAVDGSLRRLGVEHLDLLLLHRPDYLMDPHEVAGVFDRLRSSGKVANFGVSNFSPSQVNLLQSALDAPLRANQVEINLHNISTLTDGTLDQCLQLGMTPQAWCPLAAVAYPAWGNTFNSDDDERLRRELSRQQAIYDLEHWQIALAWLLAHPAGIRPIIGSTTPKRIEAALSAPEVPYAREDWYRLLEARNGHAVP